MEPGIVAAYGVETAIEAAAAASIVVAKPTLPLKARFTKLTDAHALPRSSHSLCVVNGRAYVFGGEIQPRTPVDNRMHIYTLPSSATSTTDYESVPAQPATPGAGVPAPRVGHTAASLGHRIYVFGGRGGADMSPLDEHGRLWVFDTQTRTWSRLDPPATGSWPCPQPRSYHASTAAAKRQVDGNLSTEPQPETAHGLVFVHAGCAPSGRLNDLWAFDTAARAWRRLHDAPGAPRGGPCLAYAQNRLYRFGGFDGQQECGGQMDCLDVGGLIADGPNSSNGSWPPQPRGESPWQSTDFEEDAAPENRSVAGMQPVTTGQGRGYLLVFFGEGSASAKGHDGAGKFFGDVWCYQLEAEAMTGARLKDAVRKAVGAKTHVGSWARVEIPETTLEEGVLERPGARGWFASSVVDTDMESVVLWGGIDEGNERLGDGWVLRVEG